MMASGDRGDPLLIDVCCLALPIDLATHRGREARRLVDSSTGEEKKARVGPREKERRASLSRAGR
jgi:hypothetical protein